MQEHFDAAVADVLDHHVLEVLIVGFEIDPGDRPECRPVEQISEQMMGHAAILVAMAEQHRAIRHAVAVQIAERGSVWLELPGRGPGQLIEPADVTGQRFLQQGVAGLGLADLGFRGRSLLV